MNRSALAGKLLVAITRTYIQYSKFHVSLVLGSNVYTDYARNAITEIRALMSDGVVIHDCFYDVSEFLNNFEIC